MPNVVSVPKEVCVDVPEETCTTTSEQKCSTEYEVCESSKNNKENFCPELSSKSSQHALKDIYQDKDILSHTRDSLTELSTEVDQMRLLNRQQSTSSNSTNSNRASSVVDNPSVQLLENINAKLETLTQTVVFMEKRLSLVEDQVRLVSAKQLDN